MTNAEGRDLDARIEEAVKRVQADGATLWSSLVNDLGFSSHGQPLLLSRLWDILPSEQRPIAIASAWTISDSPSPEEYLPAHEWLKMFRTVGYIEDTYGEWPPPPAQITLWRGGVRKSGMSWTADRERAEWFRDLYERRPDSKPGKLWTATVSADHLLAHFHVLRPGEEECVVNPAGVDAIDVAPEGC